MTPEPIYRAIMLECEQRRIALNLPMEKFSEFAGLPERYFAKALWADQPSGRQAQWGTLQIIMDTLYPDGFDLIIKPRQGPELDALRFKYKVKYGGTLADGKTRREHMSIIGRKGAQARLAKLPPKKLQALMRKAGRASGRTRRAKLAANMPRLVQIECEAK